MTILLFLGFSSLAVFGLLADFIGIGNPHTFGISQILAIVLGLAGCVSTYFIRVKKVSLKDFSRGAASFYVTVGVNILNLIVLICLVELGFTLALKYYLNTKNKAAVRDSLSSPAYEGRSWFASFHKENGESQKFRYAPFVIWEREALKGETVNIDDSGIRKTVGGDCTDGLKVYVFGGSTVWGVGSPDWNTIPSELQKVANSSGGKKICFRNLGENAFVSTQSAVRLMRMIQAGDIPDVVIFYIGFNEFVAARQTLKPGMHQNYSYIEEKLNSSNVRNKAEIKPIDLLRHFMPNTHAMLFVYRRQENFNDIVYPKTLPEQVGAYTKKDIEMVKALGEKFKFDTFFFLQPSLFHKKQWTKFEEEVSHEVLPDFKVSLLETYTHFQRYFEKNSSSRLFDISDTFENAEGEVFIDKVHLVPEGNAVIAKRIWDLTKDALLKRKSNP